MTHILLKLARKSIEGSFDGTIPEAETEIKEKFSKVTPCFVCLTKNGKIRGISGNLKANKEIFREVIEHSIKSAFHDKNFSPLKKEELSAIKIELFILNSLEQAEFDSIDELLNKINQGLSGVAIEKGYHSANFLPKVWEEISDKDEFLSVLCEKAGLPDNEWKKSGMKFWIYTTKSLRE
ncbi:AmmeMemoRadiSam system protein A [Candidatus Pacearchaeota archaeon]|nr:AmmeMemoRadiSam system protein A [Candidatus Pacearchaeota archaeon]